MAARQIEGRKASPSAGVIARWGIKTESGGPRGYDAVRKIMVHKCHIISDTLGLMLFVTIHAASIQDRNGAVYLIKAIRYRFPGLRHIFADGGYAGEKLANALRRHGQWALEIVRGCDAAKGFVLLPHRWVVEPTFAWLGRCRRLAKDWERTIESFTASTTIAHIHHPTRLITSHCQIT
jgi:putative transposase